MRVRASELVSGVGPGRVGWGGRRGAREVAKHAPSRINETNARKNMASASITPASKPKVGASPKQNEVSRLRSGSQKSNGSRQMREMAAVFSLNIFRAMSNTVSALAHLKLNPHEPAG